MYKTVNDVNLTYIRQSNMAHVRQSSEVKPANVSLTPSEDSEVRLPRPLSSEYGMNKAVKT